MEIFGHSWVDYRPFVKIFSQEDIDKVTANDIVLLEPLSESIQLAQYCQKNSISFAVAVSTVTEALFANALSASYAVCQTEEAISIQLVAKEYLFDMRILALITHQKEIEKMTRFSIDGVIFPDAIAQV